MEDSSFDGQYLSWILLATVPFLYAAGLTRSILPRVELPSSRWQPCTLVSEFCVQGVICVPLEADRKRRVDKV